MINMQQFDAVIFDMDGVVVDTENLNFKSMCQVVKDEYGIILPPEYFNVFVGHATSRNVEDMNRDFNVTLDTKLIVKQRRDVFEQMLEKQGVDAQPGFWQLIDYLKKSGIKTGLCTSSLRYEAEFMFAKILRNHPEFTTISDIFDASVTASDVTYKKPHPEPYAKAMSDLGAGPGKCLVFEDSALGMQAAREAGCGMLIALRHPYNGDALENADQVIDSLEEMLQGNQ